MVMEMRDRMLMGMSNYVAVKTVRHTKVKRHDTPYNNSAELVGSTNPLGSVDTYRSPCCKLWIMRAVDILKQ